MSLESIVAQEVLNGLGASVMWFLRKRGLNQNKAPGLAKVITAEYSTTGDEKFPFPSSLKTNVDAAVQREMTVFAQLLANNEEENLRKMVRTIVAGETLSFMDSNIKDVMMEYAKI